MAAARTRRKADAQTCMFCAAVDDVSTFKWDPRLYCVPREGHDLALLRAEQAI